MPPQARACTAMVACALAAALACARRAPGGACADPTAAWRELPALAETTHLFAFSSTAAWVVGPKVFLDWDGCVWRAHPLPSPGEGGRRVPEAVWASGPRDLWLVMSEPFYHRADPRSEDRFHLVQPASPAEIWRWDRARWSRVAVPAELSPARLTALWGFGPDDVWLAGFDPERDQTARVWEPRRHHAAVLRWDGQRFRRLDLTAPEPARALWGASPAELWVGGPRWLQRLRGIDGPPLPAEAPPPDFEVSRIWGRSAEEVWAAGWAGALRWDGRRWSPAPMRAQLGGTATGLGQVWGAGKHTFASGAGARLFSFEGERWVPVFEVLPDYLAFGWRHTATARLGPGWLSDADDGWALGRIDERPALLRWDGRRWSPATPLPDQPIAVVPRPSDPPWTIRSARAVIPGQPHGGVFVAGRREPAHALPWQPLGAFAPGADSVWIVGPGGSAHHFDGARWEETATGTTATLLTVWEAPSRAVAWAGGATLLRRRGGAWEDCGPLHWGAKALWGSSEDDVWAVGQHDLHHWDGEDWATLSQPLLVRRRHYTSETIEREARQVTVGALWGSGRRDVWAVGNGLGQAFVARWDGVRWIEAPLCHLPAADRQPLYAVWGRAAADVWAAGRGGTLLHWDGRAWWSVPSGTRADVLALAGTPDGGLWLASAGADPVLIQPEHALAEIARRPTPDPAACDLPLSWELPPTYGEVTLALSAHRAAARECLVRHGEGRAEVSVMVWRNRDGSLRALPLKDAPAALESCLSELVGRVRLPATAFEDQGSHFTVRARTEAGCRVR